MNDILVFGAGYCARAFAAAAPQGTRILGTTRSQDRFPMLAAVGIEPLLCADAAGLERFSARLAAASALIVTAAPGDDGDPALAAARAAIRAGAPALGWIGYLSTVGVYGGHDGAWIDETALCRPKSARSAARVAAEAGWIALGEETGVPVAVLRLSGIYGPGRNAFVNLADGTARRLVKPGQVFNRIHVADIAGALRHLGGERLGGVFNVTDDLPAPPQDVVAYAAARMGVEPPPEIPFETAELSPMARSFYGENKRVANARLKAAGYRFLHPDYRAGLDALWADGSWRGDIAAGRRSPIRKS